MIIELTQKELRFHQAITGYVNAPEGGLEIAALAQGQQQQQCPASDEPSGSGTGNGGVTTGTEQAGINVVGSIVTNGVRPIGVAPSAAAATAPSGTAAAALAGGGICATGSTSQAWTLNAECGSGYVCAVHRQETAEQLAKAPQCPDWLHCAQYARYHTTGRQWWGPKRWRWEWQSEENG